MPAKIIETNDSPLNTIDVDGITVDLIENALKNAREEMDALVSRTALSPGIREQGDCFPMIAIIGKQSPCSLIPGDKAVLLTNASISSLAFLRAFSIKSTVMPSTSIVFRGESLVSIIFAGIFILLD